MIQMGDMPEDFDIPKWMTEHGYETVPVGKSFFIVPVHDRVSDGDYILLGIVTVTDGGDEMTQVIALDQMASALIAANLSRRVGPEAMYHAMMHMIEADVRADIEARKAGEAVEGEAKRLFDVPPSQEVVEQMIKDDIDKDKDGY